MSDYIFINSIENVEFSDFNLIGGKARHVNRLFKANIQVQKGFVLKTNAYNEFLQNNNLDTLIKDNLNTLDKDNTQIKNIKHRMQNCLIGKDVSIYRSNDMPVVYGFILADDSRVRLI